MKAGNQAQYESCSFGNPEEVRSHEGVSRELVARQIYTNSCELAGGMPRISCITDGQSGERVKNADGGVPQQDQRIRQSGAASTAVIINIPWAAFFFGSYRCFR